MKVDPTVLDPMCDRRLVHCSHDAATERVMIGT